MSTSFSDNKAYPGCDYSLSQLVHAIARKLRVSISGRKISTTTDQAEVDGLEKDALEVLSLVRSLKDSFAPVNRIPTEVLSLIPDYYMDMHYMDRALISLTHVCRGWRETFISRSSLWAHLDLTTVDKTQTYIRRSKSSPLRVHVEVYLNQALSLVIPQIPRLRSLTICTDAIPNPLCHFRCRAPLLEDLVIDVTSPGQILDSALFDGDLSSLHELSLVGVTTDLPWTNMANLGILNLSSPPRHTVAVTRLLDFLESAPLLHTIDMVDSIPNSSDSPPGRVVSLRRLNTLTIYADPVHSILNHLCIPTGASLMVWTTFRGEASPLLYYLLETSPNISNLWHITAVNLCFHAKDNCAQLSGPSGSLRLFAHWEDRVIPSFTMDHRILHSLDSRIFSTIRRLTILGYMHHNHASVEEYPDFQALSSMNNLHTLVLSKCYNQPFIRSLNPEKNSFTFVPCPNLKEIVLYIRSWVNSGHLISMTKGRTSRGAKISSITIIGLGSPAPEKDVLKLRKYVTHVEFKTNTTPPAWDDLPDESGSRVGG